MRIRRALEISLGLVVLLLLWQIGATWRRPLPPPLAESVPPQGQAPRTRPPSRMTPESLAPQVDVIAAKNLFDPDRGRVEEIVTTEPTKVVPPPSHLKLVGIVVSRSQTEAMFTDATQGGKAVRVKQGDTLGEYHLLSVTPTEVKLGMGTDGGEVTLALAILESGLAAQAPQMMVPDPQAGIPQGRHPDGLSQQEPPMDSTGENASQEEAQALRENIQQMQQRLRQIRRRAAIDEARARGETIEEDQGAEEE